MTDENSFAGEDRNVIADHRIAQDGANVRLLLQPAEESHLIPMKKVGGHHPSLGKEIVADEPVAVEEEEGDGGGKGQSDKGGSVERLLKERESPLQLADGKGSQEGDRDLEAFHHLSLETDGKVDANEKGGEPAKGEGGDWVPLAEGRRGEGESEETHNGERTETAD